MISRAAAAPQAGLAPLFRTLSTFVKIVISVIIVGYVLSFHGATIGLVPVTPGYLLPPHFSIWTLCTFFLIEFHFWEVLVDIVTLGLCGKLIEPLWGHIEMISFFLLCNLCSVVLTTICYLCLYMVTKDSAVLFEVRIYGLVAYVSGVSVAVQQIMPDHPIVSTPLGTLTNRNIPLTVLLLSVILWLFGLLQGTYPLMYMNGILVSWVYLRFFQHHSSDRRGDPSESFQFEKFFPTVLQPSVKLVVNLLYIIGLKCGCRDAKKQESLLPTRTPSSLSVDNQLSDLDYVDVERRRQIALKALNERLSSQKSRQQQQFGKTSTSPTPPAPSPSTSSSTTTTTTRGP